MVRLGQDPNPIIRSPIISRLFIAKNRLNNEKDCLIDITISKERVAEHYYVGPEKNAMSVGSYMKKTCLFDQINS
jgi:hypothetical protein